MFGTLLIIDRCGRKRTILFGGSFCGHAKESAWGKIVWGLIVRCMAYKDFCLAARVMIILRVNEG